MRDMFAVKVCVLLLACSYLAVAQNEMFVYNNTTAGNNTSTRIGLGLKILGVYLAAAAVAAYKGSTTTTTTTTPQPGLPTFSPPGLPTLFPTGLPTFSPPGLPTIFPTGLPTFSPSGLPTFSPTGLPTFSPFPTGLPTFNPLTQTGSSALLNTLTGPDGLLVYTQPTNSVPLAQTQATNVVCACLPAGTCVSSPNGIDIRIVTTPPSGVLCPTGQQYCCIQFPGGTVPPTYPTPTCGRPATMDIPGVTVQSGQARFGEYPWSAILMTLTTNQFVGGATLIGSQFVLTVAHNVVSYPNGAGLQVRLGDWNVQSNIEPYRHLDVPIAAVSIHPQFDSTSLRNDIALITLSTAVPFGTTYPQIAPICLPSANAVFTGQRCYVSGWGRDSFQGNLQSILKQVDVPVVGSIDCQTRLRATRLGLGFVLDTNSFICAGGEYSKDACTGDGGSALVCRTSTGQYVAAGLTSWGIGCASSGVPGVYVNVANYLTWLSQLIGTPTTGIPSIDPRRPSTVASTG